MAQPLPDPNLPWPLPMSSVGLIADSEGLRLKAYPCQAGVWTIGWGETEGVQPGDVITKDEADRKFLRALIKWTSAVSAMCTEYANPNQLGALVSLAYNIGLVTTPRRPGSSTAPRSSCTTRARLRTAHAASTSTTSTATQTRSSCSSARD